MKPTRKAVSDPSRDDVQAALAAMGADELREVVREIMLELDDRAYGRVASAIIRRGARGGSGWVPAALDDTDVAEAVAFAQAAKRVGHADPADVDERLRRGVAAFLRKEYNAAHRIFGALLRPIAEGEIDLGQHEMIDEVLGVDANECAMQYVVSDIEDLDLLTSDAGDEPQLATPEVDDILRDAGVEGMSDAKARKVVLAAMRKAAEMRVGGVIDQKRRRHYGHAASLVAACVACDGSPETGRWAATLRGKYRRFPAFCAELDRRMGSG